MTVDTRAHTTPFQGLKIGDWRRWHVLLIRREADSLRDHVLGIAFDSRRQRQCPVLIPPRGGGNGDHALLAVRQRPRLVKHDDIDIPRLFERQTIAYEDAVA